jgi:hypothetical protein
MMLGGADAGCGVSFAVLCLLHLKLIQQGFSSFINISLSLIDSPHLFSSLLILCSFALG